MLTDLGLNESDLEEKKAIEVGNIFSLGTRFSEALGLKFKDADGKDAPVVMGSYGIGSTRMMGVLAEVLSDDKGLVWPKEVAPFAAQLISISGGNADVIAEADRMYDLLREHTIEVLYDDRDARAGEKFADADLIGIPTRIIISEKTVAEGGVEISARSNGKADIVPESQIIETLSK